MHPEVDDLNMRIHAVRNRVLSHLCQTQGC